MNNRQRGKNTERSIAKIIGGRRVGLMGKEDIDTGCFSVEVKHRKSFAACPWMDQAIRNCASGKTPLLVVHVHGSRHDKDLVVMTMNDWQDWHGSLKK